MNVKTENWETAVPQRLDSPLIYLTCAIQSEGFSLHRMDCTASSGKVRDGGVCFLINTSWSPEVAILASSCSPDLEYLTVKCHLYYLPQEFISALLTAVYITPRADVKLGKNCTLLPIALRQNTPKPGHCSWALQSSQPQVNATKILPAYKQKLKRENPVQNIVQCWSVETEEFLLKSLEWACTLKPMD